MPLQINWDFVSEREGGRILKGYVPKNKLGQYFPGAGVTIATGVDLGRRSKAELDTLRIPMELKLKLLPYIGARGWGAAEYLEKRPLIITEDEAKLLDMIVQQQIIHRMIREFEAQSDLSFDAMPAQFQTVMASLAWNLGAEFGMEPQYAPIWKDACAGCMTSMAVELEACPVLPERRKLEAKLLREIRTS